MFENVSVIEFMVAVAFIVIFSVSFGMEMGDTKGKRSINRWFRKMITKLLGGGEEDQD